MKFFTTAKVGPHRETTPAGYTLFKGVTIARTGIQIYGPGEVEIDPGPDGLIHVERLPEYVFDPESMSSGEGQSFTINHPVDDVCPNNWQHLSHGFMANLRRGEGLQQDELLGDLLVTTSEGIASIDSGKRELSLGYDAPYTKTGDGRGYQGKSIINHLASVDSGRCGGRCSIRDHHHTTTQGVSTVKKNLAHRILDAFKTRDEDGLKKILDEESSEAAGEQHIHIHNSAAPVAEETKVATTDEDPNEKRFAAIEESIKALTEAVKAATKPVEQAEATTTTDDDDEIEDELGEEAPQGTQDAARKSRDSAYLVESFEAAKMNAEIISPGIKIKTLDRSADPKKSFRDCICGLRRKSLQAGLNYSDTASIISQVRGRTTDAADIDAMSPGQVRTIFNGVAALKKAANNAQVFTDGTGSYSTIRDGGKVDSMARFKAASAALRSNNK